MNLRITHKENIAKGIADLVILYMKKDLDDGRSAKNDTYALRRSLNAMTRGSNSAIIMAEDYLSHLKTNQEYATRTKTQEHGFVEDAFKKAYKDNATIDKILNEWLNIKLK